MDMLNVSIVGVKVSVPAGTTVLEAARQANVHIPTLCYLKDINEIGACRMCVVDVGARALAAACVMPVSEGMVVKTNTPAVRAARKSVLELILSNHKRECLSCVRSQNCELQKLSKELGVDENHFAGANIEYPLDNFSPPSSAIPTSASCAAAAWLPAVRCSRSAPSALWSVASRPRSLPPLAATSWRPTASSAASASTPAPWAR